jgi:outer membrane protein OmpA-like peptidoglycan-associated protein
MPRRRSLNYIFSGTEGFSVRIKKLLVTAFICSAVFAAGQAFADDAGEDFDEGNEAWINNVPPMSYWGLRGLSQTVSAEPLGMGRLNIALFSGYFKQEQDLLFNGKRSETVAGPGKGASVTTLMGTLSWGVNDWVDVFGNLPIYIVGGDKPETVASVPSELMGGVQFAFPIPEEIPLRLAVQVMLISGLRTLSAGENGNEDGVTFGPDYMRDEHDDPLIKSSYAGYEYGVSRKKNNLDVVIKIPVSLVAGNLRRAVKLHLNGGFAGTYLSNTWMLLSSGGVEIDPTEFLTIGAEINSRTPIGEAKFAQDPLWFTPSLMFRSPYYADGLVGISFVFGADIRLSSPKDNVNDIRNDKGEVLQVYPLEPYRIFGDLAFSFDILASKRRAMVLEARRNAAEKARLRKQAELTAAQKDSIARKAYEDSLALASSLVAKAEKARQDSIAQAAEAAEREARLRAEAEGREAQLRAEAEGREAQLKAGAATREAQLRAEAEQKRIADSIALAETKRKLDEERAKRSEAEQQMLSTGMIVLDGVFFVTGKAEIQLNSRGYLTTLAKMLVKYPKLRMEIGGHTDNTGNLQANMTLSQRRADAVFLFMNNINPALAQMLTTKGYGPTVPKADNATAEGRELNRRVELRVLNPEVLKEYNP